MRLREGSRSPACPRGSRLAELGLGFGGTHGAAALSPLSMCRVSPFPTRSTLQPGGVLHLPTAVLSQHLCSHPL